MSPSKEALIHKWKTARHIVAASLLGVSAIAAGGTEASSRFDRILQEVPTPVVTPEETVEEVEQEPQSGIQATIPPTPVVLVYPTPTDEVVDGMASWWPNYGEQITNVREAQLELVASLPEFTRQGYQSFTHNGEQVPFGMVDVGMNLFPGTPERLSQSTHAVAVTAVERTAALEWPGVPGYYVRYLFVVFQYENTTFVATYGPYASDPDARSTDNFYPSPPGAAGIYANIFVTEDIDRSQLRNLRLNKEGLEERYRQAMENNEQVIVQFLNMLQLRNYAVDDRTRAEQDTQSLSNASIIEAIETGNLPSVSAGVLNPEVIIFLQ